MSQAASFRAAVLAAGAQLPGAGGGGLLGKLAGWSSHRGSAPAPLNVAT
jgi:hypothetical protein